MWWHCRLDLTGEAYFGGRSAPSLQELTGLAETGVEVTPLSPARGELWSASLRHPRWGSARLRARREAERPPEILIKTASGLTEAERERIALNARSVLTLEMPPQTGDMLRDRKQFLRFMAAVLGREGVAGHDLLAQTFWSPERLSEELQHDAPLDIIHMHVLHAVTQRDGMWLHSHGLAEMGFVDFDVLRPAEALTTSQFDLLRSIAFLIVEGASSGLIEPAMGADAVDLIDAKTFMRSASATDRALRDPDGHSDRRVVCCDPARSGLVGRLFGSRNLRPSSLLCQGMMEGEHLIRFSDLATKLGTTRALESLTLFVAFRAEFEDMKCSAFVKLGYPTDGGSHEHLWFEVHGMTSDRIDGTLLNQPFDIVRMKAGDRGQHPIELLSDWSVMTPLGQITPRSLNVARKLRESRPEILRKLRSQSS
jgi:uncharacterized protein YegJ (DUF2314 family)